LRKARRWFGRFSTFKVSNDTATRVGSDGLIEKVRTNYLRYSQDFSQWTLFGGATRTTGVTDPNGGTTAATISNLSSGNFDQGLVLNSNPMTIGSEPIVGSIWLKGTGTMAIYLERSVSGTYFFYSQEITLTSTWTRYQVTGATAGSRGGFSFGVSNFVGSTATSVDIAFGQTEFGDVPTNYIATTTAAVSVGPVANLPRLDYLGSSCPSLLLEPQRTNLATYSEQANQYTKIEATIGSNVLTSPDGYTNADSLIEDGTTDIHAFYNFGLTTFTAAAYTASIFAKKGGRDWFALQLYHGSNHIAYFNLNTGAVGTISAGATATITNYGNGWYRCTITATTTANAGGIAIYSANADNSITYAGTNGLAAGYFYGLQLELGAYATSYIPTLGAAVTRGADSASKTGIASLIGQSEGFYSLTL
jgi:hypothetical protein